MFEGVGEMDVLWIRAEMKERDAGGRGWQVRVKAEGLGETWECGEEEIQGCSCGRDGWVGIRGEAVQVRVLGQIIQKEEGGAIVWRVKGGYLMCTQGGNRRVQGCLGKERQRQGRSSPGGSAVKHLTTSRGEVKSFTPGEALKAF